MKQPSQSANLQEAPVSTPVPLLTSRRVFAALAVYFLCQVLWRVFVSNSVELDESEQLIQAQGWNWGYSGQPPLYTWLQSIFLGLFGWNAFSLVSLKFLLLFGIFYCFYRAAREATGQEETALLAALGLFFLPQIAWEAQRDLTHSVLATFAGAVTLFVLMRLFKTGGHAWYLWLGLVAGLGLLAKYNYVLFLLALLCAAASIPEYRARLFSGWMLLGVLICMAIASGHLLWLAHHPESVSPAHKLTFTSGQNLWQVYLKGCKSLVMALLGFGGPLVALFGAILLRRGPKADLENLPTPEMKWLGRTALGIILFCALAIVCFKAQFKDRWFQPLLFFLPLYAVLRVQSRLTFGRKKLLAGLAAVIALTILFIMPAIPLVVSISKRPTRLNAPWSELAQFLQKQGVTPGVIVADSCLPGGNFKIWFPQSLVLAPECAVIEPKRDIPWLVVWEAPQGEKAPPHLLEFYQRLRGGKLEAFSPSYIEAPYKYLQGKRHKLGFVVMGPGD